MKRLLTAMVLLTGLAALPACGNTGGSTASVRQKLNGSFSVDLTLEMEDFTAEGTLTRCGEDVWSMYFDTPSEVAGVQLDFSGEDVAASYKGLSFSVPQAAMPSKQILMQCIRALEETAQNPDVSGTKKDGKIQVEGELESGEYILGFNEDGSLADFRMDNMGAVITFGAFNADVQLTTTVTTIASLVITTSGMTETEIQTQ